MVALEHRGPYSEFTSGSNVLFAGHNIVAIETKMRPLRPRFRYGAAKSAHRNCSHGGEFRYRITVSTWAVTPIDNTASSISKRSL